MNRLALPALALLATLSACKPAAAPEATPVPAAKPPVAAAPIPATSAREEVAAAMRKFWNLRSYHADMHLEGGPRGSIDNAVDFVAPDRYRMQAAGRGSQVIIGDTMYLDINGRSMQVPMPAGTISQWRDPAKLADAETEMEVDAQGSAAVDGQPAKQYLVRVAKPKPTEITLWIGADGLPLQIASPNPLGQATIKYSRFDDPTLTIEPPK